MTQAPAWFEAALAVRPEVSTVDVDGAEIELLSWGERGKPGLLLMHGFAAHAAWWSFIAPLLATHYRVTAFSWSGMGRSARRSTYTMAHFVAEILAAADATALFDATLAPTLIGHSFGGYAMMAAASTWRDRFSAAIIIDTPFSVKGRPALARPSHTTIPGRPHSFYPSLEAAAARFRLMPPQTCVNEFATAYIARASVDEQSEGWSWAFDPYFWDRSELQPDFDRLPMPLCPTALIYGDRSALLPEALIAAMVQALPPASPVIGIPDAGHHVMLDQPLALVAALRGLLAGWPNQAQAKST